MERLFKMISVLLANPILVDKNGDEFCVTGFADDGATALLHRSGDRSVAMRVRTLDGLRVEPKESTPST